MFGDCVTKQILKCKTSVSGVPYWKINLIRQTGAHQKQNCQQSEANYMPQMEEFGGTAKLTLDNYPPTIIISTLLYKNKQFFFNTTIERLRKEL
jgi:hypothetical protein